LSGLGALLLQELCIELEAFFWISGPGEDEKQVLRLRRRMTTKKRRQNPKKEKQPQKNSNRVCCGIDN
jgi:hypothetical protein